MTSGFYGPEDSGSSPFDDFLARIYGTGGPRQPVHRVDITRLMSAPARELLSLAATHAAEQGGRDLDTEQLLWAAASMEPTRTLLARAGADSDALVREIESQEAGAGPSGEPPQLTPGAKRALLDAHQISRVVGSTYIGPEHILFALAANPESGAGRILSGARVTPETLQQALIGQGWTNSAAI
jgi:ATP-dependent Clp protease ATP-binding subunit ClpC